jgi:predicted transcriptional regulator
MNVEDETSFDESIAEAERGEFVSDETIQAFWAKHAPTSS